MQLISTRLALIPWYGPPLELTTAFAWKSRIKVLRLLNPAGSGKISFDPARSTNSFTTIPTGSIVELDALGINSNDSNSWFEVDNGIPAGGGNPTQTGTFEATGNGRLLTYQIPHSLGSIPTSPVVVAGNADSAALSHVTATVSHLLAHFSLAPAPGAAVRLHWALTSP